MISPQVPIQTHERNDTGYDLVCFGYNPWSHMWKRVQTIVTGLVHELPGRQLFFLNQDVTLSDLISQPFRELQKPFHPQLWLNAFTGWARPVQDKVVVRTPVHWIPCRSRARLLANLNESLYCRALRRLRDRFGMQQVILWVNRPMELQSVTEILQPCAIVFDWSDDWASFAQYENCSEARNRTTDRLCDQLIGDSNLVLTVSQDLLVRARKFNPHSYWIPNGTDWAHFARTGDTSLRADRNLASLPRPVLGYVGYLMNRLDFDVLEAVATAFPQGSLAFIGPQMPSLRWPPGFLDRPNVHYLGIRDYDVLPNVLKAFDVALIPHRIDASTRVMDPIKLYDYLATGKPIVSTPVSGVNRFTPLVRIGSNPRDFITQIQEALTEEGEAFSEARREAARRHSWDARIAAVASLLRQRLASLSDSSVQCETESATL